MTKGSYNFFFFGTLMDSDVLAAVIERNVPEKFKHTAILNGWRRVSALDVPYPIIVDDPNSKVVGQFVEGLTYHDAINLMMYEGGDYGMVEKTVEVNGMDKKAFVFVPSDKSTLIPLDKEWSLDNWQKEIKPYFFNEQ